MGQNSWIIGHIKYHTFPYVEKRGSKRASEQVRFVEDASKMRSTEQANEIVMRVNDQENEHVDQGLKMSL